MSLPSLSDDGIACICSYLSGNDVLHLMSTGCRVLGEKLRRNCLMMDLALLPFQSLPTGVYRLPRLESVSLSLEECYDGYPIRLLNRPFEVMESMNWVTKLKLGFAQSFSVLSGTSLRDHVPNLRKLLLTGSTIPLTLQQLSNIPPQLTTLKFQMIHVGHRFVKASLSLLAACLPPHLETFVDNHIGITYLPDEPNQLPLTLRKLILGAMAHFGILRYLPPRMEHVDIHPYSQQPEKLSVSTLPRTLKHFSAPAHVPSMAKFVLDGPIPPNLEYWAGTLVLPPSANAQSDMADLAQLLGPRLKFISRIGSLPLQLHTISSLTNLSIDMNGLHQDIESRPKSLPEQLKKLLVLGPTFEWLLKLLPPSITDISMNLLSCDHVNLLSPFKLQRLTIVSNSFIGEPGLHRDLCLELPRTLTHLSAMSRLFSTVSCLNALPVGLKTFELFVDAEGIHDDPTLIYELSKCGQNVLFELTASDSNSHSEHASSGSAGAHQNLCQLQALSIHVWRQQSAWIAWMRDLSSFSKLESLEIDGHVTKCGQIDADAISRLPHTLRTLKLPIPEDADPPSVDVFYSLPPNLNTFWTATNKPWRLDLSNDYFTRLPPSLTALSLKSIGGLTPEILDIIPNGIRHLEYFFERELDGYTNAPHWESTYLLPLINEPTPHIE